MKPRLTAGVAGSIKSRDLLQSGTTHRLGTSTLTIVVSGDVAFAHMLDRDYSGVWLRSTAINAERHTEGVTRDA
jgi:hypothetical protein